MSEDSNHKYVSEAGDTNTYKYIQKSEENNPQYVITVTYNYPVDRKRRYNGYAVTLRVTKPLSEVLQANPVLVAKADFLGRVGVVGSTFTYRGIKAPKGKMYVAPLPDRYGSEAQMVNKAIELSIRGLTWVPNSYSAVATVLNQASALTANNVPWSAVVYGYRMGRGKLFREVLLLPKSFEYVKELHRTKAGQYRAGKVRIFFYQDLLPGFNVGEVYKFHIEVLRPGRH